MHKDGERKTSRGRCDTVVPQLKHLRVLDALPDDPCSIFLRARPHLGHAGRGRTTRGASRKESENVFYRRHVWRIYENKSPYSNKIIILEFELEKK